MEKVEVGSKNPSEKKSEQQSVPLTFEEVPPLDEHSACPTLENTKRRNRKEIWLIKVPLELDASSLTGKKVILNGTQSVSIKNSEGAKRKFEVISKPTEDSVPGTSKALLPSSQCASLWAAKDFDGDMSLIKSVFVPTPGSPPKTWRSSQPVKEPDVKCRWKPFGYKKSLLSTSPKESDEEHTYDGNHKTAYTHLIKTCKSEQKQEVATSKERKKQKDKKIHPQKECEDESRLKTKKIKTEKASPRKRVQVKVEK